MVSRLKLAILFLAILLIAGIANTQASLEITPQALESQTVAYTLVATPITIPTETPALETVATPTSLDGLTDLNKYVKLKETQHFAYYGEPDSYAQRNIDRFAADAEVSLQEMGEKLGLRLSRKVMFYLYSSSEGNFSALSFASPSLIYEQFDAKSGKERTRAVTAHELAHQLTFQSMGYPHSIIHLEGIAHWASEPYWIKAEGKSFDDRVSRHLAASRLLTLSDMLENRSLWRGATQLAAYDEAGSFVGYLIRTYGLDKFKQIYMSPGYEKVYGKDLPSLEQDWLASLK